MTPNIAIYIVNQDTDTITDVALDKIVYFGFRDFMDNLVKGNNCFICGASPNGKTFNDEHVIPDWVLRRFNLHKEKITLPNDTTIRYGQYKLPCCVDCNAFLGKTLEKPISDLLNGSYRDLVKQIDEDRSIVTQLFIWMSLIYSKTHLKNTTLLQQRAKGADAGFIGDVLDWNHMHHVHCIARSAYSGAAIDERVFGSMLILPASTKEENDNFDYMDSVPAQCAMIQVGEICIFAVLNDSAACQALFAPWLKKISGALTSFQLKEIFAHMVFLNMHIKQRPVYHSGLTARGYEINVDLPETLELADKTQQVVTVGELLHNYIGPLLPESFPDREAILQSIKEGKRQFLLNEEGEFAGASKGK
jgi:hypothetical protein